ncbi:hypothetical protein NC653_032688 [Populus alba x Populus x berolinensis]|uniref:Uncharacterized protein n=1 Tax=Populus alba x Populus x berolinensis TaxID=444605 RepID=A0AAD6LUU1_9ROSI|nr:hypothetical protein NC653_032688 [Populus alba x Populus x berolinensis]
MYFIASVFLPSRLENIIARRILL